MIDPARLGSLSERERECLRLLMRPLRAKAIARELGLSYHTVNDHLRSARAKLGTTDSFAAAALLRDHEDGAHPNAFVPTNLVYPAPGPPAQQEPESDATAPPSTGRLPLPFATVGRPWNDLNWKWRALWPILLVIGIGITLGALFSAFAAISQLVLALHR